MPGLAFLKGLAGVATGGVAYDTSPLKVMLLNSSHTPNATTQEDRADIAANEISGTGYTAGGATATASVTTDAPNSRVLVTFGSTVFSNATITARNAAYYLDSGAAATDTLLFNNQFSTDYSSLAADFELQTGSAIRANVGAGMYFSCAADFFNGDLDFDTHTFKVMLLTNSYAPSQSGHSKRSDLTNEVSGTGYTTGGLTIVPTVNEVPASSRINVTFPQITFTNVTLTNVRYAVFYRSVGSAATDRLVGYKDFGTNANPTGANLVLAETRFPFSLIPLS